VVTNPHNPSSAVADEGTIRRVAEIARAAGARLLVDEVYLEASSILGRPRASSFGLGPEIVVTSSLTKAYGLGGLRCGWALAEPDLVRRMWRLNDLMGVVPAHPAELLSIAALDHLDRAADHARHLLVANRDVMNAFLDSRSDLRAPRVAEGMLVFPKVLGKDVEELVRVLRERYETTVVPGRFFDMPDHVRISMGAPPEIVAGGISRLAEALDSLPGRGESLTR
jgi:aspartate/methionine/tyrosine aminotransferase